ncbi:MAG TPA: metalloregulator ArsR/SmtB family transcription factor [Vicinamibacterales bacterium]|nr:metalloregulator ArsR/SmtB family transcription factor [Vicinamibacterales bacterium]
MASQHRTPSLKSAIYEQLARIGRAIASPGRLELLDLLSQGPRTVEALATQTGQSMATTSHHLQVLRRARLVEAAKAGLYVTYRLGDPRVAEFFLDLRRLAEARLAEVHQVTHQYLEGRGALEPIDNDELARRVRAGEVTLIDVRPREEYLAGHIPGALSVPLGELPKRMRELRKSLDVVAYCRGPYCVMALDAVEVLRRKGFRAHRMELGVSEWRAHGWRIDSGTEDATSARS